MIFLFTKTMPFQVFTQEISHDTVVDPSLTYMSFGKTVTNPSYRAFHRFGEAKFPSGGLVLGLD